MPLYEYRCTSCSYKFEKIQKFSDEPEKICPKCQGELVRPMTAPALKFEGAGWYINDYAPKGGSSSAGDAKSESKPADSSAPAATPAPAAAGTPSASAGSASTGSASAGSGSSGAGSPASS